MRTTIRFLILSGISGAVWAAVATVGAEPPRVLPIVSESVRSHLADTMAPAGVMGNVSCAAASCHGADVAPLRAGGESHIFADTDPHRRAYAVLFNDRSRRMVELLKTPTPAHQTLLCLKCHGSAPPNLEGELSPHAAAHGEGASCENCHGAAEKWLTAHYTAPWKTMTAAEKAAFGFLPTKDLAFRAQLCATCHVGDATREVDHQLIAAGHPALRFELAAYQLEPLYKKHWTEKNYGADVEAWTWMIGQLGSARKGAELLRRRAAEAATPTAHKRDWPELAEYTCFSCHQDISPFSLAAVSSPDRLGRRPDSPRPGT
ncbi:MAG: cytochrome c family protein, partial [Bacteroidales bacterium]|nr:cytochrome c family protein [Bacteroidales bacterium]